MNPRDKVRVLVEYLAKYEFKDSLAPRKAIAARLKQELLEAGISEEDHVLAVHNMYPK
jgi:hypothetical protein